MRPVSRAYMHVTAAADPCYGAGIGAEMPVIRSYPSNVIMLVTDAAQVSTRLLAQPNHLRKLCSHDN